MNYEQMSNNKLTLVGTIISEPQFSHEVFGEGFYETKLEVSRLSDQVDVLPITISERLIAEHGIVIGEKIAVEGQFRSYNKLENGKSRLVLTVFVREIIDIQETSNPNSIEISGFICKQPIYRTTPFKREICDILVAVNRAYNKSDYIPCITWGRNARYMNNVPVGTKITLNGRIQSRTYQKVDENGQIFERIAYEVSVSKVSCENIVREEQDEVDDCGCV